MTFEPDSAHLRHDALLIAAHASNDLAPADAEQVEGWLRDCRHCAALHADLRSLSSALATLPKTANAPRDFRLSPAQATRLRGGPWWRRLARSVAAPRGIGRPLATAFTTLGLVGILVGSLPVGMLGLTGTAGERTLFSQENDGAGGPAPAASPDDTDAQQYPVQGSDDVGEGAYSGGAGPSAAPSTDTRDDTTKEVVTDSTQDGESAGVSPVIALAGAFLAIGLGLFAVRRFGRRLA